MVGNDTTPDGLEFIYNPTSHNSNAAGINGKNVVLHSTKDVIDSPKTTETVSTDQRTPDEKDKNLSTNERHDRQMELLPNQPDKHPPYFKEKWTSYTLSDEIRDKAKGFNGEALFQKHLYLLNVIIALEWTPSLTTMQQIRIAMRKTSDFLYDVTDGYMAIGNVIICDSTYITGADIQIMASNRLHPRAWVDALNEAHKFVPIRVGRGLWQKNSELLLTWDTPEGYRTLAHEWGHYAFGLGDEYLKRIWLHRGTASGLRWKAAEVAIAVPTIALPVESLMANTQISEFAPRQTIIKKLKERYPQVYDQVTLPITDPTKLPPPLEGPDALPLPRPTFDEFIEPTGQDFELNLDQLNTDLPGYAPSAGRTYQSHWLYLLTKPENDRLPSSVIAQGKVSSRERFRVLGATEGDTLVIISQVDEQIHVAQSTFIMDNEKGLITGKWQDATPPRIDQLFFVDVVPQPLSKQEGAKYYPTHAEVAVNIVANTLPDQVCLFPVGERMCQLQVDERTMQWGPVKTLQLDGHVFLQWSGHDNNPAKIFICGYSQGGGSDTSGGGRKGVSYTAGSTEGNAMVFFLSNAPEKSVQSDDLEPDEGLRIVTTVLPVGPQTLTGNDESGAARSYTFSIASNDSLAPYDPTLVLYYDIDAPEQDQDLLIYRWDNTNGWTNGWTALTTYIAPELPYVAIPLVVKEAGGSLLQDIEPRIERYRVFLTPR